MTRHLRSTHRRKRVWPDFLSATAGYLVLLGFMWFVLSVAYPQG